MLYCFTKLNDKNTAEVSYAVKNNSFMFFDKATKKFYSDTEGKEERKDIKGETILPRTNSEEETEELINILLSMGATPFGWDLVKYKNITRWPTLRIINQRTLILRAEAFDEKNVQLEKMIDELSDQDKTVFLKTINGSFSKIVLKSELLDPKSTIRKTIAQYPEEEIMISKPIHVLEDDLGKKEYTCVIKNGKIQSISRHTDKVYHKIEDKIIETCKKKAQMLSKSSQVPDNYIIELSEYEDERQESQVDITNIKPIYSAALWLYNSLLDLVTDREERSYNTYEIDPIKKEQFMDEGTSPRSFAIEEDKEIETEQPSKFAHTFEKYEKQKQQSEKQQHETKPWSLTNWFKAKENE